MAEKNLSLRIALVQMRCEKTAIAENLRFIKDCIMEAEKQGVDIIGFPEMSITGYANPLKFPRAVISLDGPEIAAILKISLGLKITILAGFEEYNPAGKPFITQAVIRAGQLLGCYRKNTIKDEEADWFTPGVERPLFSHDGLGFGIAVCADIDNEELFAEYSRKGARLVFEAAAPGLYGEQTTRNWRAGFAWWEGKCITQLGAYARQYHLWIAVATQAGRTLDEDFPGGGYLFSPDGNRTFATPDWSAGAAYLDLNLNSFQVSEIFPRPYPSPPLSLS